jgi:hypothetical protein
MTITRNRTLLAILLGFGIALLFSVLNGRTFVQSLYYAVLFAVIVGFTVGLLSWASEYAVMKGYPGWSGFVLVLFLNFIGVFILILLPTRSAGIKT